MNTLFGPARAATRWAFAEKLAYRMLASEGMEVIWDLHVAAADAHEQGRSGVAETLIEIADTAEREWRLRPIS